MVKGLRLYVEGDKSLRTALGEFLREVRQKARQRGLGWEIIMCNSGSDAPKDFRRTLDDHPGSFNVLLIDSEGPVELPPWEHVAARTRQGPNLCEHEDAQCQLMVQMMETWFLADRDALAAYYGTGFNANALPKTSEVEAIPRDQIVPALRAATRLTTKRKYDKTKHAPELLRKLDPAKVRRAAPYCERLFKTLIGVIERPD